MTISLFDDPFPYQYQTLCPPYTVPQYTWSYIPVDKGWECPKCGRVYSPSTVQCLHCGKVAGQGELQTTYEWPGEKGTEA